MDVTIPHNPRCSTSSGTLALVQERGTEPTVVEYPKNPPTAAARVDPLARLGISASRLLRKKGGRPPENVFAISKGPEFLPHGTAYEHAKQHP